MKITTISYQRVKNLGNYESERLDMAADLDEGEDPISGANALRDLVEQQLNVRESAKQLQAEEFETRAEIARLKNQFAELKDHWDKVEPLLAANGIELTGIPF